MLLQPLHSVNYSDFHVSGDVTIHPNVAIAPGVLIQADPDSKIIIESGTCIGMGTIIHASGIHGGAIEIKAGVTIGTGVLIVGSVTIGTNACVGSMTTILNQVIPAAELVLAGSLLVVVGDPVRSSSYIPEKTASEKVPTQAIKSVNANSPTETKITEFYKTPEPPTEGYTTTLVIESSSEVQLIESSPDRTETSIVIKESIKGTESTPQVYGQENLNRLLEKLLPHRQSLNRPLSN
jgi:carbon dioxide concentrating mechanism protein CcmN